MSPNNFTTTYNATTRTVSGTLADNTLFGVYNITFYAEDIWNVSAYTENITFEYYENMPPIVDTAPSDAA